MSRTLTSRASSGPAFPADNFKRMLWVYLVSFWDEFAASRIRTEDPGFPWCAELQNTLHEDVLLVLI
jgi:hypothetical protein